MNKPPPLPNPKPGQSTIQIRSTTFIGPLRDISAIEARSGVVVGLQLDEKGKASRILGVNWSRPRVPLDKQNVKLAAESNPIMRKAPSIAAYYTENDEHLFHAVNCACSHFRTNVCGQEFIGPFLGPSDTFSYELLEERRGVFAVNAVAFDSGETFPIFCGKGKHLGEAIRSAIPAVDKRMGKLVTNQKRGMWSHLLVCYTNEWPTQKEDELFRELKGVFMPTRSLRKGLHRFVESLPWNRSTAPNRAKATTHTLGSGDIRPFDL